mgnify:CR=1 FL=1
MSAKPVAMTASMHSRRIVEAYEAFENDTPNRGTAAAERSGPATP